ncbi:hypothetical protein Tco_1364139 [Tanacetum coccineum]
MRQGSPYHTVDDDEVLDRLKFINKGDIYQVYGKPILDAWITNEIKKSEAYKMYFKYSTGLIPPKKGRGRGAQGTKATDAPKQTNVACKKTTDASKKKQPNRNLVLHDESEGEQENRPSGRKKKTPRAVVIQEPPSIPVKKTQESSGKLEGIELLSDAAQLEIDTQRAIKASKRESRFQNQSGGSSEGAGLRPEVPDKLTGKSTDSDEGAGTLLEVPDESEDKNIPWQSTNDEESKNDDEEDESNEDKSIDIKKSNDERTDTNDEDTVIGKAEKIVEQKADKEYEAGEEQKGDEHAEDEQVVVLISTTQKKRHSLLQSTSSHSVSSNFGNQFINSPNASLISTILENAEAEINSLLDIQIQQDVPNIQQGPFHAVKVSELKQADHSTTILASIRSHVPSVVKEYLGSSLPDAFQKVLDVLSCRVNLLITKF